MNEQTIPELEVAVETAIATDEKIHALNRLARAYVLKMEHEQARPMIQEAYALAENQTPPDTRGMLDSLTLQTLSNRALDVAQTLEQASTTVAGYRELGVRDWWSAAAYGELGGALNTLGDHAGAMNAIAEELAIAREVNERNLEAWALNLMGVMTAHHEDYAGAIPFFEEALTIFESLDDTYHVAGMNNNLCYQYRKLGRWETALAYGEKALELYGQLGRKGGQSLACGNLGEIYLGMGDLVKAGEYLQRSYDVVDHPDSAYMQMLALTYLGPYLHRVGQDLKAIRYLREGLKTAEEVGNKKIQADFLLELAKIYEARSELDKALNHYQQHWAVKEQIFTDEALQKVKNLEVLHRTQRAVAEVETQKRLREEDRVYFEKLTTIKDEFLLTTTHDLKSPLASIMLATEMLELHGRVDDEAGQKFLARIRTAAYHMRELITNTLDLAKIEAGRVGTLERRNIVPLVRRVVETFEAQTVEYSVRLRLDTSGLKIPNELVVDFDPPQIQQALQNLLSNAFKFTPRGGQITVRVGKKNDAAVIEVVDTGMGIPAGSVPYIFERFYRVPTHEHIEGTGLGLAIVQAIVEKHNGTLEVESEVGAGTTFRILLGMGD